MSLNTDVQAYMNNHLLSYIITDLRMSEATIMSDSPFSLKRIETTGWKFTWYSKNQTYKWDVEDLFMDGECVYIGPNHPGVNLVTIKKSRSKLNINWEKKTISYKGEVDGFDTWEGEE